MTAIDTAIQEFLYAMRDPFLVGFSTVITQFADTAVVMALAAMIIILLAHKKRWASFIGLLATLSGASLATYILKALIARPRPSADMAVYLEHGFSFPSGHATLVVAFYGFLFALMWDKLPRQTRWLMGSAFVIFALAIGFSRLYLGVHYASDILGGYVLGALFLYLGIKLTNKLKGN